MDPSTATVIGGVVGAVLGGSSVLAWRFSEREQQRIPESPQPQLPPGVANVLSVLRSSTFVVGPEDQILQASAPARMMGLVNGRRVAVPELLEWVRDVRRDGQIREEELVLEVVRAQPRYVSARVAPLSSQLVLVLVEDHTSERRADTIRRDFVANVSHELKTPVGALNLLAEAVSEAAEDPTAVRRFASRMQTESERLTRLVQQIIELSRLQGDDPLEHAAPVAVSVLTEGAIDRIGVDAAGQGVDVSFAGDSDLSVVGDVDQLVVALGNLVENAVGYSPAGTRVTVSARRNGDLVEIAVTDRGVGIPASDLDRIFERFYRVDPARARATGGTGLGLSIVKHVAATHGGEVRVWSVEGQGSTFTLAVPAYDGEPSAAALEPDVGALPALATSPSGQESR
ncbi:MAG: sensor histidine kinase [Nocardioidaceae bacterium]